MTEICLGFELRPKTRIGPGLAIHHGYGLVVNDGTWIGAGVTLRHGVTIGHSEIGGRCPVIMDRVDIGSSSILLGDISIAADAKIGAGAVVIKDVGRGRTVVGNPAHPLP